MPYIDAPSPNFDARTAPPDMIVLHYTGMPTGEGALARLRDPEAKVSSHYLVEEDGRVFQLVPEARRAWHAGVSFWKGERDLNGVSIGVEIVNPGHEFGYRPFPEPQIAAVIGLVADIRTRWSVPNGRIVGHSDIAPTRKADPGELFPWDRLAKGDEGPGVFALQAGLTRLGYESPPSGHYDDDTAVIVTAFQRHWRPARVDGIADGETRARLVALLRAGAA